ncbi:MAG TPA: CBS domain-containing protein, partial [Methanomassiliicoccales archaeon]|nr:CBS domain-containing protein [Methanomassiliicoccales archaeon]
SKLSGVSQSTIAKIEKGRIHGSYESVVRIFDVLQGEMDRKRQGRMAKDVMSRDIVSIQAKEKVKRASEMMRESGYSQLPVFEGSQPVGSVSEFGILAQLRDGSSMEDVGERTVRQIMSEAFPVISEDVPLETVTTLLSTSRAVLVGKKGQINGIITSSDVLKLL